MVEKKQKKNREFVIGSRIQYNGKLYKVVEEDFCDECSIKNICVNSGESNNTDNCLTREQRLHIFGECSAVDRIDRKAVVFQELVNYTTDEEFYNVIPLYIDDKSIQLRPVEFDLPNGYKIDEENSNLDKGIIRFKYDWLTLDQLYKLLKGNNYISYSSSIKDCDGKLFALANFMDIAKYFNGDWKYNANGDECGYIIAYDKTITEPYHYQIVHINADTDMYFGNVMFKNEADAQYVIDNPNFRDILDKIFKV